MDSQLYGPVLLVCIYNKLGNIITHDYFYQVFSQYGEIVKVLIFEKAKVWKTFVEFTTIHSANVALTNLNNHVVFEDGSKMNIFPSKLRHIKLQNYNLGGVNYEELKTEQELAQQQIDVIRTRRSTFQDHTDSSANSFGYTPDKGYGNGSAGDLNCIGCKGGSYGSMESTYSLQSYSGKKSWKSFSFDIDQQFLELARESEQFRQLQRQESLKQSIRRKSKTIVTNPNMQQFVLQNSPSKVLFIRSLPQNYTNKCLYNIFRNFGNVLRVIYMQNKTSGLVEFDNIENAINAKDQINYAKPEIKIFYSHYETLSVRKQAEGEDFKEYNKFYKGHTSNINPPSEILYITMVNPGQQQQIRKKFEEALTPIYQMEWKRNGKDRWMCLADLGSIDKSLLAMGFLQGMHLGNGKDMKLSFTRSKLSRNHTNQQSSFNE